MRSKIIAIVATLILALSAGTSPAIAKKSVDAASPGLYTASEAIPTESFTPNSWSWGVSN